LNNREGDGIAIRVDESPSYFDSVGFTILSHEPLHKLGSEGSDDLGELVGDILSLERIVLNPV
jgi:hypothetical protein